MDSLDYIVILDTSTGETFYKKLDTLDENLIAVHIEEFFNSIDLSPETCFWMFTATKPKLIRIN